MFGNKKDVPKCPACVTGEGDHSCIENPEEYAGGGSDTTVGEMKEEPMVACRACEGTGAEHTCM